ncbi:hypothetical protein [Paucidesulfovibrio longus]|uniref:hypothetical protein n=1 Tax=Paucidesulfovibrio longus TaxID=889 RepID=UPI0003B41F81|nr:hypothetical protein [Paucidesulfovibrio longus]
MDKNVVQTLKTAFAADIYESVRAARKHRDETVFRHTLYEGEDGMMVFCGFFPKADIQLFPGLTDDFTAQLKTFNMVGVITDGSSAIELFHLGGQNTPFTSVEKAEDLIKVLDEDRLMVFLQAYFEVRGMDLDVENLDYDAFMAKIEAQVFQFSTLKEMQIVDQLLNEN